jgi:hypothetical protein
MIVGTALRRLFEELREIGFDLREKESHHENLTDILEILAVAAGLKPAHLNGQGFRSETLLVDLERVADHWSLFHTRTAGIVHHRPRALRCDVAIAEWKRAQQISEAHRAPSLLWIYQRPELSEAIGRLVRGEEGSAVVLGYPQCCVLASGEKDLLLFEEYVRALVRAGSPQSPDQIIRQIEADAGVMDQKISAIFSDAMGRVTKTRGIYPFVSYTACGACLASPLSPTARLNRSMKDLALSMSAEFVSEIVAAAGGEPTTSKESLHTRSVKVGRNDSCPCGSGKKYKKCHGAPTN